MFLVLSGKKGSGKDSIADRLIKDNPNVKFQKVGLADYLKEIVINLYGLERDICFGPDKNKETKYLWENMPWFNDTEHSDKRGKYVTHREFLQYFGSEICRSIDPCCWTNYLLRNCTKEDVIYINIDCRFPEELNSFLKGNALVIRLLRNPHNDPHISENALNDFPFCENQLLDNRDESLEMSVEKAVKLFNSQAQEKGLEERLI